ncbi:MAG: redoxin domain-containing protein [Deltaproteobacteria bacterium]|nr:redoxin domain-containing protein [Deltaproteobacteria bacterium]
MLKASTAILLAVALMAASCNGSVTDVLLGGPSKVHPVFPDLAGADVVDDNPLTLPDAANQPVCASKVCPWGQKCDPGSRDCVIAATRWDMAGDFGLEDHNLNSATHGQVVRLSDQAGGVTVVYFSLATCSFCLQQVKKLQDAIKTLDKNGYKDIGGLVIIHPQDDGQAMQMGQFVDLPLLQDHWENSVWGQYKADKDYTWVVDRYGYVRNFWPLLDFQIDRDVLMNALKAALVD